MPQQFQGGDMVEEFPINRKEPPKGLRADAVEDAFVHFALPKFPLDPN
jgi:hypothetical protein